MMFPSQRGVSLLESLVALVAMAMGAVAVIGMQATLRLNGDVAKQRAEALRLAQEVIEEWRGFTQFGAVAGQTDWTDLVSTATASTHVGSNTTFARSITVVAQGAVSDDPLSKTVHVTVSWNDRTGQPQTVTLNTVVAGIGPELGGALSLPADGPGGSLIRSPRGRHPSIPQSALDQGDGTSRFTPPGSSTDWIFSNASGLILPAVCPPLPDPCVAIAVPLYGFVRFETGLTQPTPAMAEAPTGSPMTVQVVVDQEVPIDQNVNCYQELGPTFVGYYCAVPINLVSARWTGHSYLTGLPLASSLTDSNSAAYRVCRYTPVRDNSAVAQASIANENHPLGYLNAGSPLVNQNFLVIRAGDGAGAFTCPADDASTPKVDGSTWHHQPDGCLTVTNSPRRACG